MNRLEPALLDLQNISVMAVYLKINQEFSLMVRGYKEVDIMGTKRCDKCTRYKA